MTRPNNIKDASGRSFYALGLLLCSKCNEWMHKDDESKVKKSKGVGLALHRKCSNQLRSNPYSQKWRRRYHEKIGVKHIE